MTSIVLVHTGRRRAPTLISAIKQLQTYLPSLPIYLITDRPQGKWLLQTNVEQIDVNELPPSEELAEFQARTEVSSDFRDAFWIRVMSRHFLISQLISQKPEDDWLHIENDCLLLTNHELLEEIKHANCGIAVPFESRARAIPVLVHIKNRSSARQLSTALAQAAALHPNLLDMDIWAAAAAQHPGLFTPLPTMPDESWSYPNERGLPAEQREFVPMDWQWANSQRFSSVFDAAALGQYLGGADPHNQQFRRSPGFINPTSGLDVEKLEWKIGIRGDDNLPQIEIRSQQGTWATVANLHMHSKQMRPTATNMAYWQRLIDIANQKRQDSSSIALDLIVNAVVDQPKHAARLLADLAYNQIFATRSTKKVADG